MSYSSPDEYPDLADPRTYDEGPPHDFYRHLRAHEPVSWHREPGGPGYWVVTRHADLLSVVKNPKDYSSWRGGVLIADPPPEFLPKLRQSMLSRDPPDHTRYRRLVGRAFSPRRLAEIEARIAAHADKLVEGIADRGSCDFVACVAGEMPLFVICEILGVPPDDRGELYRLTTRMLANDHPDPREALADGMRAAGEMRAYGAALGARKRASPGDDLVSDLLAAQVDGHSLSDEDFQAFFMLLFNAGADTTRSLLAFGLDLLLDRPAELARLRADPSALPVAIEELIRFISPVMHFRRTTTRAVELGGKQIEAGAKVVVCFNSANRDEQVFAEPDVLDLQRHPNPHVGFGAGPHTCLGGPLARMESRHVLRAVLERLDEIERVSPLVRHRSNLINSARALHIRYTRRSS